MREKIIICDYEPKYREQFLSLHRETVLPVDTASHYEQSQVEERLRSLRTVVAVKAQELLGFCIGGQIEKHSLYADGTSYRDSLQRMLDWAHTSELRSQLEALMNEKQEDVGGKVVVHFYDNDFLRGMQEVRDSDYALTDLAVFPKYRRRGVGTALLRREIDLAKESGAAVILGECWQGGRVARLMRRLGFCPIIEVGPMYDDGNAAKYVGRVL